MITSSFKKIYICSFVVLRPRGSPAHPVEEATNIEVSEELFKELKEVVPKDVRETHEVAQTAETDEKKRKRSKRKISHENVLEEQYKALILKQENLTLKKRKLELEVFLLEQRACLIPTQVSINLSP